MSDLRPSAPKSKSIDLRHGESENGLEQAEAGMTETWGMKRDMLGVCGGDAGGMEDKERAKCHGGETMSFGDLAGSNEHDLPPFSFKAWVIE